MTYSESRTRLLRGLTIAAAVLFVVGLYLALFWVGPERQQGAAQRIFYVHLGSFLGSFIAFGATVVAGIAYLRTRNAKWDTLGLASVEIGLGLSAITVITGKELSREETRELETKVAAIIRKGDINQSNLAAALAAAIPLPAR